MPNAPSLPPFSALDLLRAEIAAAAARMIAEEGADYGSAKRRAARMVLGDQEQRDALPDNALIEEEVRIYNELFFADTQPARLAHLRRLALQVMEDLAQFSPYLTGAVLKGTAGAHSDIHLHLFTLSPKDVEIFLLNKNLRFEVSVGEPMKGRRGRETVEVLSFLLPQPDADAEGVHLTLYHCDDLHAGVAKPGERADLPAVRRLLQETS
ncbi:hypothetical protein RGU70_04250 [Herbaspirillum sp. RTI4]|uniref:hypothetical protein n=1 Tax=Herbaspirillum sp. RTI4 TaxID=3048640 RepID=UPI002AB570C3|nr:hypothetical protein [Herbaspirillum sp. RTI4]MDY7577531.1 hypothetical protein [Herbaspirillum sp. RTI4]MEA9981006.1 hypothetical protein [Herbaspirillum sp. RTI4]